MLEYGVDHIRGAGWMVQTTASKKRGEQSFVEVYRDKKYVSKQLGFFIGTFYVWIVKVATSR
jgi:hypothetical protein